MKGYFCSYPFIGSLTCEVEAENEEQAKDIAYTGMSLANVSTKWSLSLLLVGSMV